MKEGLKDEGLWHIISFFPSPWFMDEFKKFGLKRPKSFSALSLL